MDDAPPRSFALLAAVFEGALAVAAVALGWLLGRDPLARETLFWSPADLGWALLCTLPLLGMLWLCLRCPLRPLRRLVEVVDELLVPMFGQLNLLEMAVISALAGLGEEMLFRVIVQQAIADGLGGAVGLWSGLLAAAVLFGLLHQVTVTYAVLAGLIGLYLGGLWIVTGNLLVPMVVHALYDFLALIYVVRIRR